ncbi:MAG: hypothetical protein WB991_20975, partial [Candidatus Sulfotelmatobacter sp.]
SMARAKHGPYEVDCDGHGHARGRQGPAGYAMPISDAHKQSGQYIPQSVFDTYSDGRMRARERRERV